ncbi:MAG: autotransporter domain-containing protein [Candidatus Thiodiazotropha lotti]|nr:autotransporter domain-containing protein [Candidatus Thiodiazotropha lotti]MCG8005147.1 autotransporter domain-containing protein [Candidatus Thiodiazotropha lotti]MCG8007018.1 autotransporter domain-containing protein [Candidatus Thiodiazotropha lotti]MCW4188775.1 autotransporter domain-containing protein [Candidatus Thiodiazotropha lotti]MCW4194599.1 autotransporter domain-containing protein [Candidatus Thiodiazotropha lotti]
MWFLQARIETIGLISKHLGAKWSAETVIDIASRQWMVAIGIMLLSSYPLSLTANDIQLSGLSQSPPNSVAVGSPITYSLTTNNIDDGVNPPSSIGISIRMRVDGAVVRADSGEIDAVGCSVDASFPDYFACNNLVEGGSQTPSFTWNSPTPGNHTVLFEAACQLVPVQTPTAFCPSFGTSISTTTQVGAFPTAVVNPAGPVTIQFGDPIPSFDLLSSFDPDGSIVTCEAVSNINTWITLPTCTYTDSDWLGARDPGVLSLAVRVTDNDGLTDLSAITIIIQSAPTANAGIDQTVVDSDNNNSEAVTLDGSGSTDNGGTILNYVWLENGTQIANGVSPTVNLGIGTHTLTLQVFDNDSQSGQDQVVITVLPGPNAPTADAGQDQQIADTDSNGLEDVSLDASNSVDSDGTIVTYEWIESGTTIATGATPTVTLAVGTHTLTLRVTDSDDLTSEDQITVTVATNSTTPVADAGIDQSLTDRDGDGSESVTLNGTNSTDPDGSIVSYQWYESGAEIATGSSPTIRLNLGTHTLTLTVTDDAGLTHQDQVTITVNRDDSQLEIVAGDNLSGSSGATVGPFTVQLTDLSGEPVADSIIVWSVIPENAALLTESESTTDQNGQASTTMTIQQTGVIKLEATLNTAKVEFVINSIAQTPGLSENEQSVGSSLDDLCPALLDKQASADLSAAEQDLLTTCNTLVSDSSTDAAATLALLAPEEVAAQGSASIEAATAQHTNVNTRLLALRRGDTGMNLSGLTVNYAGISFNRNLLNGLLPIDDPATGGGAGDDALIGRWGAFINGTVNFGEMDDTEQESGFDFDTRGITFGLDYRFSNEFVAGGAIGYSRYDSDYNNASGNLEMDALSLSAYGTYYQNNNIYIDGLIQIGSNSYETSRRVNTQGSADQFGQGDTDGMEYAFNLGAGYEYHRNALTITPYGRLAYTRAEIDAYSEQASNPNAAGVGSMLRIEDQELKSMVLVVGGNLSYNLNLASAVLIPHFRFEWEHEFSDDSRFINARFVSDPTQSRFSIETDEPDRDYFNLGLGLSAVFAHGKTGFLSYETRLSQDNVTLNRVTAGIRIEF